MFFSVAVQPSNTILRNLIFISKIPQSTLEQYSNVSDLITFESPENDL